MDANHGYLCRILAGKRDPTISFLEKMGEALGMGIEELRTAIKARAEELRSH
jgi:transcriptional regulator with XRE-family HTH domain